MSATTALHNFIITHDPSEISQSDVEMEPNEPNNDDARSTHQGAVTREERTRAAERRDRIAKAMWEDFIARPTHRRR